MSTPLGNLIDSLGVTHTPREGDLVASVVVLLKVIDEDGSVSLRTTRSEGLSWIEAVGMLRVAESIELADLSDDA